jgi:hypothetical protein
MLAIATPLINGNALWKIVLAALIGGAGVVIVFGFLLLFVKYAQGSRSSGQRAANYAVSGVCGAFCVAAIVFGVYAMSQKPKSKPAKPPAKSAQVARPGDHGRS